MVPFAPLDLVAERLPLIFPEGTPNRLYCTRDLAALTVFTALYVGAVEGAETHLAPFHVYRMSEGQAALTAEAERTAYRTTAKGKGYEPIGQRWYADNSREGVRDETIREGLVPIGAMLLDEDVSTTSAKGRYQLRAEFAALFDPALTDQALTDAIEAYRTAHLSPGALARVAIMMAGAAANASGVTVKLPNGTSRQLSAGPSTSIAQSVIEVFAPKFLQVPALLWLSESGNKVVFQDEKLATRLGLNIKPDKNLPDLILADVAGRIPLLVFVELVATDGAISPVRQAALYALTDAAGYDRKHVVFVTAYADRQSPGFKKTVANLAWNSFTWFASEPDHIVEWRDGAASFKDLLELTSER